MEELKLYLSKKMLRAMLNSKKAIAYSFEVFDHIIIVGEVDSLNTLDALEVEEQPWTGEEVII